MPDNQRIKQTLAEVTNFLAASWQQTDGGWPLLPDKKVSLVEPTALAVLWLLRYDPKSFLEQIKKGLEFLASSQNGKKNGGGWGEHSKPPSEPIPTGTALLAFVRYTDWVQKNEPGSSTHNDYIAVIESGRNWLQRHVKSWSRSSRSFAPAAHAAYWACIALKESENISELWDPNIENIFLQALAGVEKSRRDKGWGETLSKPPVHIATAYCTYLMIKYSMNPDTAAAEEGVQWLRENYKFIRASAASPPVETTARVTLALLAGKQNPRSDEIKQGIDYLLNRYESLTTGHQGTACGWPYDPEGKPQLVATHSACRALFEYQRITKSPGDNDSRK